MSPIQSRLTPLSTLAPLNILDGYPTLRESQQAPPTSVPKNRFWSFLQRIFICSGRRRSVSEETIGAPPRYAEVCKQMVQREMEELQCNLETHIESLSSGHRRSSSTEIGDLFQEIIDSTRDELAHTKIERQIEDIELELLKLLMQKQDLEYEKFTGTIRKQEARNKEVKETDLYASYDQIREVYNALKMILFLDKRLQLLLGSAHPRHLRFIPNLRELITLNKSLLKELRTNSPPHQKIHQIQKEISQIQNQNFSAQWIGDGPFAEILNNSSISKWCYDPKSRYQLFLDNPFLARASKRIFTA